MLTLHEQQLSFSTHERVFLRKCQSFWDRKCLDLRGTPTTNLRIVEGNVSKYIYMYVDNFSNVIIQTGQLEWSIWAFFTQLGVDMLPSRNTTTCLYHNKIITRTRSKRSSFCRIRIQVHFLKQYISEWLIFISPCHDLFMMTSSNGNTFRVNGHLCEEVTGEFPTQRPVTRSFDAFFDLCMNKR